MDGVAMDGTALDDGIAMDGVAMDIVAYPKNEMKAIKYTARVTCKSKDPSSPTHSETLKSAELEDGHCNTTM